MAYIMGKAEGGENKTVEHGMHGQCFQVLCC